MTTSATPPPPSDTAPPPQTEQAAAQPSGGAWLLRGVLKGAQRIGQGVVARAVGALLDVGMRKEAPSPPDGAEPPRKNDAARRVGVLHAITEQLRGAADDYVAAKLDEIEARVDQKLDVIEERIDRKIVTLHQQLAEMRDRELRYRLRLLRITLIFTALVAVLSLLYKWVEKLWHLA